MDTVEPRGGLLSVWAGLTRRRASAAGCAALVALSVGGCGGQVGDGASAHVAASTSPIRSSGPAASEILRRLGARRLVVMAGDDRLRAGLGTLGRRGLRPMSVRPADPLVSNVAGNGRRVVLGASTPSALGFAADGVFQLSGDRLRSLAPEGSNLFGPSISARGTVAAVHPYHGYSVRERAGRWLSVHGPPRQALSSVAWGAHEAAFALVGANRPEARIVQVRVGHATRPVGSGRCGATLLHAPGRGLLAVTLAAHPPRRARCRSRRAAVVHAQDASVVARTPRGWNPIAWSANSRNLLLARGRAVMVWSLGQRHPLTTLTLSTRVWMAAAVYRRPSGHRTQHP